MQKYNPQKIEKKWQKMWYASTAFKAQNGGKKKKLYLLNEFPYPSGDGLHVGHCRPYIGLDVIARKKRLEGFNVLYPMGWDAFGLPTENYAIKTGVHPTVATKENTANFKKQMNNLGLSFDWSREINTTDPAYYKWTQWIFIKLFEAGLAYKDTININWCPKDKTGLANEEVINGKCERCGTAVEKREKSQWLIKITKYADRLIEDLKYVDYPSRVKDQQTNWIGRSEGAEVEFKIHTTQFSIPVFTTRIDTIFGCTFLVVAPEHPLLEHNQLSISNFEEVKDYIAKAKNKSDLQRQEQKEKTGVELKGVKAINPATGKEMPVFVADYVLSGYGTGAIMAVPAHDERDFEFAKKYSLPITKVIEPTYYQTTEPGKIREGEPMDHREAIIAIVKHWKEDKYIALRWKQVAWGTFVTGGIEEGQTPEQAAKMELREEIGCVNAKFIKDFGMVHGIFYHVPKKTNRNAHAHVVYLELENDEKVQVSEEENAKHEVLWLTKNELAKFLTPATHQHALRWLLGDESPYLGEGTLANSGEFNRLESVEAKEKFTEKFGKKLVQYKLRDWVFSRQHYWGEPIPMVDCPSCGWVTVSEKELPIKLPNVKKYQPTDNGESPLSDIESWVNVKCPKCKGAAKRETDTMPNWAGSNWYYLAYTVPGISNFKFQISNSAKNISQWLPVDWYNGGMEHTTLHLLYSRFIFKFLWDIGAVPKQIDNEPYKKRTSHGIVLAEGGVKMSKSKGNVINPDAVAKQYGADTLRVYEMFMGPFEQMIPWDTKGIVGARRFLEKVYTLALKSQITNYKSQTNPNLVNLLNKTIKKVGDDIEAMKFNTAISSMMTFVNEWSATPEGLGKKEVQKFLAILSPFAPHLAAELGLNLKTWPAYEQVAETSVMMIVSVNGKVRDKMEMKSGLDQSQVEGLVLHAPKIKPWLEGKQVRKIIFVPNKLINIVI